MYSNYLRGDFEGLCQFDPQWDVSGLMKEHGRTTGVYVLLRHFDVEDEVTKCIRWLDGLSRGFLSHIHVEVQRR